MRKFIILFLFFVFGLIFLSGLTLVITCNIIDRGGNFKIPGEYHSIILGHSHSACALNDSLLPGFCNLSQDCEGYPYTFFKALKILENNPNVKRIFLEFETSQIMPYAKIRVSGDYLIENLPRHLSVMDAKFAIKTIISNGNVKTIFSSLNKSIYSNLIFVFQSDSNYIDKYWRKHITPSEVYKGVRESVYYKKQNVSESVNFDDTYTIEPTNMLYLSKIVKLCKEKKVELYLIRSPLISSEEKYEKTFQTILNDDFGDLKFLDFKDCPLEVNKFADSQHLNVQGEYTFTMFFKKMIEMDILKSDNPQFIIESQYNENI